MTSANPTAFESLSDQDLIKQAYSLLTGPETVETLYESIEEGFEDVIETVGEGMTKAHDLRLDNLNGHFENALSLVRQNGRQFLHAEGSSRNLDANNRPSFTVDGKGRVIYANDLARSFFAIQSGAMLASSAFSGAEYGRFKDELAEIEQSPVGLLKAVLPMRSRSENSERESIQMCLSRVQNWRGEPVGLMTALHVGWYPHIGRKFAELMKLSKAELEITKAIVLGVSLSDLAVQRGRSVATVRNQSKKLFKKLDIGSQTELACLYSGFSQFAQKKSTGKTHASGGGYIPEQSVLAISASHCINYGVAGVISGRPVIYLPQLLCGQAVTPEMDQELKRQRIRLIMPWRAGYSSSYKFGEGGSPWTDRVKEVEALMDHLKIASATVVGQFTTGMYAYALAAELPERIEGVVGINIDLPVARGEHRKFMGKSQKCVTFLAQKAPKVGRLVLHSAMSRIESGHDVAALQNALRDSPADLRYVEQPNFIELLRAHFEDAHAQGYDAFADELLAASSDWHHLVEQNRKPVRLIVGDEEPHFPVRCVQAFAKDLPDTTVEVIRNTGNLCAYQKPSAWISATDFSK